MGASLLPAKAVEAEGFTLRLFDDAGGASR